MAEQRYQTVLAVISDGLSISQVASKVGGPRGALAGPKQGAANVVPVRGSKV